jgi:Na+/H+-dicarboxylate symporter
MKRPKLIIQILIALVLGVLMGIAFPVDEPDEKSETSHKELPGIKKVEKKFIVPITDPLTQAGEINDNFKNIGDKISPPPKAEEPSSLATKMKIFIDIFMLLIKMIIAPLVFSVLVVGIAKLGDFKSVGRIGIKALTYFISASLISLMLGLLLVNLFQPGKHLPLTADAAPDVKVAPFMASEFVKHVIPSSVIKSMAENEILPIVLFSIFFGIAAAALKDKSKIVIDFFESLSHIMFKVTGYVMAFAPLAVFGAVASVVAVKGPTVLSGYAYIIGAFYVGLLFFVFVVLSLVCWLFKIKYFKLLAHIKEPVLLAFSTTSSEAAMPKTLVALNKFGCPPKITGFILPLGYSFNLDGSMMYMTFASISIAQAYGIEMTWAQQIEMLLIFMLTSKGIAGVPRASLVVIASMMSTYNIPEAGLALIIGIDHFLDMGRSATNVVGNAVATAVVSKWEGELDGKREPSEIYEDDEE